MRRYKVVDAGENGMGKIIDNNIIGQSFAQRILANMIETEKIPHSILLWGPAGTGKYSLAVSFASALNCTGRGDATVPCGECLSCHRIASGNHPDVTVVEPDGLFIKIDQVRQVIDKTSYKAYDSGWKVWVLKHADRMRDEAANSLLKILEEPPSKTIFILTAENLYSMLPTVISRCQPIRFEPVPYDDMERFLIKRKGIEVEKARMLSFLTGGSLGLALETLTEGSLEEERRNIIDDLSGLRTMPIWDVLDTAANATGARGDRDSRDRLLRIIEIWYRDILVYKKTGTLDQIVNMDKKETIVREAGRYDTVELIRRLQAIKNAQRQIAANANPGLVFDNLYLSLHKAN